MRETLGERLIRLRKENRKTQEMISKNLGVGRSTYAQYETNSRKPDHKALLKLAAIYDVTTDYLLGNRKESPKINQKIELTDEQSRHLITIDGVEISEMETKVMISIVRTLRECK